MTDGEEYMGHILVWPWAPSFFFRGGDLVLDGSGDGYRDEEGTLVYFQLTEENTGLQYRLTGEVHRVKAFLVRPRPEGNRVCPRCGAVMHEEVTCPKEKRNLCARHCRGCPYDRGWRCIYRTVVLRRRETLRERAAGIVAHMKFKRRQ